jgi:hypothetical protein
VLCFTQRRWRWPWRPPGRYNASTRPMVAYSGFTWSHRYTPSGDVPRSVSPWQHGHHNRRQIRYILYNRVANKWINSQTVNGFSYIASTITQPDPFGRGYTRPIGRIHRSHAEWGANGTTMVVMFVDCCVCGVEYFPNYSYCRILRGGSLCSHVTGLSS